MSSQNLFVGGHREVRWFSIETVNSCVLLSTPFLWIRWRPLMHVTCHVSRVTCIVFRVLLDQPLTGFSPCDEEKGLDKNFQFSLKKIVFIILTRGKMMLSMITSSRQTSMFVSWQPRVVHRVHWLFDSRIYLRSQAPLPMGFAGCIFAKVLSTGVTSTLPRFREIGTRATGLSSGKVWVESYPNVYVMKILWGLRWSLFLSVMINLRLRRSEWVTKGEKQNPKKDFETNNNF